MVGLPEIRRGSLTLVTRPSTVAPTGINVVPLTTTACVTLAWKWIADLGAESCESSIEPHHQGCACGHGRLVWAASMPAKSRITGRAIHFFMGNLLKVRTIFYPDSSLWGWRRQHAERTGEP